MSSITMAPQNSPIQTPNGAIDSARTAKIVRAAREFESQLLSSVFEALEHSFSALGEKSSDPGADNYQAMAMQALGKGLAASGGIGIANMIIRNLVHTGGVVAHGAGSPATKVTSGLADE